MATQQNFWRTFTAMFWGWFVCNLITTTAYILWFGFTEGSLMSIFQSVTIFTIFSLLYSGAACTIAWLFILFPTDVVVGDTSILRKPRNAAICGATGGFTSIVLLKIVIWVSSSNNRGSFWDDSEWVLLFGALAAITGLTAALHVVLKHPRLPVPPTKN